MIKIIVKKKGTVLVEKELGEFALSIGSSEGSEIHLPSKNVSSEHATVSKLGSKILIENYDKDNPVSVNGNPVTSMFVDKGDKIEVAEFSIIIEKDAEKEVSVSFNEAPEKPTKRIESEEPDTEIQKPPENPALKDWLEDKDATSEDGGETRNPQREVFVNKALKGSRGIKTEGKKPDSLNDLIDETLGKGDGEDLLTVQEAEKAAKGKRDTVIVPLSTHPRLYIVNFKTKNRFISLDGESFVIGRSETADIILQNSSVSSKHATIEMYDNVFRIKDHGSTNGTMVNGEAINEKTLKCHDIIAIGDVKLEFLEGGVEPLGDKENFDPFKPRKDSITKMPKTYRGETASKMSARSRLYLFALGLIILGFFIIFLAKQKPKTNLPVAPAPKATKKQTVEDLEKKRITLHNLSKAKEFIEKKKYEEAKNALKVIVEGVDPNNKEAAKLIQKIEKYQKEESLKKENARREALQRAKRVKNLLSAGKKLFSQNRLSQSRRKFEDVLKIEKKNPVALKYLNDITIKEASLVKEKKALAEKRKLIESLYYQGISYYEDGNYDEAAVVLRQVVEYKTTDFYKSASEILARIEKIQMADIEEQLLEVDTLIKGSELIKAENILRNILKRFPKSKKARNIYDKIHKELVSKAKKVYSEGLVYENVVDDVPAAIESYEEVLRLLPNKNEEYHKKAKARLKRLR